jgi:hypothetical protein
MPHGRPGTGRSRSEYAAARIASSLSRPDPNAPQRACPLECSGRSVRATTMGHALRDLRQRVRIRQENHDRDVLRRHPHGWTLLVGCPAIPSAPRRVVHRAVRPPSDAWAWQGNTGQPIGPDMRMRSRTPVGQADWQAQRTGSSTRRPQLEVAVMTVMSSPGSKGSSARPRGWTSTRTISSATTTSSTPSSTTC